MAVVYQHRRKDTNEVFYIGWGKQRKRAYEKGKRNRHWTFISNKIGYEVDILIDGCTEEEAKAVEVGMIQEYGRRDLELGPLVNMTDGGDGISNMAKESKKNIIKTCIENSVMRKPEVVEKWKNSYRNRSEEDKHITKNKLFESVFGKYTQEEIDLRYKKMGEKMKGVKRPHTSVTMKGQKKETSKCENCGIVAAKFVITLYHNNNCKYKIKL